MKISTKLLLLLALLLPLAQDIWAQGATVCGIVKTGDGDPMPGVTVILLGTSVGNVTDVKGYYSLSVEGQKDPKLEFSFLGTQTQIVAVGSRGVVDVTLEEESVDIDDVVVIGYGSVRKKEITGAVGHVNAKVLEQTVTSDLGAALQGQVAGVNVVATDGAPGSGSEILIRGVSSVNGNNTPLYVVDGVPQEGDPRINPSEIESVDILKDAASSAIYGTRGAAGVIIITTKQGKAGDLKVSLDASYGIQNIGEGMELLNAKEQTYLSLVTKRNTSNSKDDLVALDCHQRPEQFRNNTSLSDMVFINNAPTQNYNANISGGNKGLTYSASVGYYSKDGVIYNSGFEKFSSRINTNYTKNKWSIAASLSLMVEDMDRTNNSLIINAIKYLPTQDPLDLESDDPITTNGGDTGGRLNWVLNSFNSLNKDHTVRTAGNFNLNYKILKSLRASARFSINEVSSYNHQFVPFQEIYDTTGKLISQPTSSKVEMSAGSSRALVTDFGLNYDKFIKKHRITLYAGITSERNIYDGFLASKQHILNNDIKVLNGALINPEATSKDNYTNTLLGSIFRLQYNWNSRYMLSMSLRRDGSSKFAEQNRWGTFPSASVAWNVLDESFMSGVKEVMNNFKIRASYGATGNQNFTAYSYAASITSGMDASFGAAGATGELANGATQVSYANPNVKWETTLQSNFGIDLGLWRNKLTVTAEYYDTSKHDMLFPVSLAGTTGAGGSSVIMNVGNMTNNGYELALGYNTKIKKVSLNVNGTFSTNNNVITNMMNSGISPIKNYGLISGAEDQSLVSYLCEGYEAGAFFLYTTNGIADTNSKLADYQRVQPTAKMGDLIYEDNNGDGKISDADRKYCGSGLPEYEMGLNVRASYRGFDFSMMLYSSLGHEIMNGSRAIAYSSARHKDMLYSWSEANPTAPLPAYRGDAKAHSNYQGHTDMWLESGDYLRIKQITLGYTIPTTWARAINMESVRLYLTSQNPLTFTNYSGFDP